MSERPLTTEEDDDAAMRRCAEVLDYGHLITPKPAPVPLVTVPIPDAERRSTETPGLFGRRIVAVPHLTYVIRSGPFVKIGATANVENRVRELRIDNPHEVEAIAVLAGGRTVEGSLHRRFKAYRHRHEWFRIEGELADWIERGCPADAS